MKKLIVVTVAAIALIANMQAQNKKWSLKECIDYAILHNIEVKQSQNRIKSLKVERNQRHHSTKTPLRLNFPKHT